MNPKAHRNDVASDVVTTEIIWRRLHIIMSIVCFGFIMLSLPLQAHVRPLDLADEPLMAQIKPAPTNIMFVLDDSGSMTYDILVIGQTNGSYPSPDDTSDNKGMGFCYVFDYQKDDVAFKDNWRYMGETYRKFWRSQYYGDNVMYYNPNVTYRPWPGHGDLKFGNADKNTPRRSPTESAILDLDRTSFTVKLKTDDVLMNDFKIIHAHYFDRAESGDIYLVVIDGNREGVDYYKVINTEGTGYAEEVKHIKKVDTGDIPAGIAVKSDYNTARQNFANWFTYHRRRDFVAKNAIANVVKKLEGFRVGILAINGTIILPLEPVDVWDGDTYNDETESILNTLYGTPTSYGDTPLRECLYDVGEYYRKNDKKLVHHGGGSVSGSAPPYFGEDEGGPCQKSVAIIMTDGYYTYPSKNIIKVGNVDRDDGDNPFDGGFYADSLADTLADVAMYYYKNDLSPDADDSPGGEGLTDRVYNPQRLHQTRINTALHQHMLTYGLAFGVAGNLDPADYEDDPGSDDYLKCINADKCELGKYPEWPNPGGGIKERSTETIDDLFHASVNGRGKLLAAKDPQSLANALSRLADNIINRLGSSSSVTTNGDALYGQIKDHVLIFQASYQTFGWTGDVKAYGIDTVAGDVLLHGDSQDSREDGSKWSAAESLNAKAPNTRKILSYDGETGIEFYASELADRQKEILGSDYEAVVDYIRGSPVEGYRVRSSNLGDIVHSSPVFKNNVLYVGANDGMLHAFEIRMNGGRIRGEEIFAYLPDLVYSNLKFLTEPNYRHRYFVDLTPTVAESVGLLGGAASRTILVGGLGKGGRGYFALDITTPRSISETDVLWEFPNENSSDKDRHDMGYSFSKPVVVRTNSTADDEFWAVIAGNGYASKNGRAALFILRPGKPAGNQDVVIRKIVPDVSTGHEGNGLSSPIAVDVNFDKKVDFVFAGDLYGNIWKFDLTAESASEWKVAYNDKTYDRPLFTALGRDSNGRLYPQPITSKPEVMFHPRENGLMVMFGTGKFLGKTDFYDKRTQTVYGIWDYGDRSFFRGSWGNYSNDDDTEYQGAFVRPKLSKNYVPEMSQEDIEPVNISLKTQTSVRFAADIKGNIVNLRAFSTSDGNYVSWRTTADAADGSGPNGEPNLPDIHIPEPESSLVSHAGWYFDLPQSGERVVSDVLLRDGRLIAIGFTPDPDLCNYGGDSFFMEFDSGTGYIAGTAIFDINNDGLINDEDLFDVTFNSDANPRRVAPIGIRLPGNLLPPAILQLSEMIEVIYLSSDDGSIYTVKEPSVRLGITYWKELFPP
ncbi:MAG: PilC/PilY family type IV pilus protein [Desulfobacterales bacterium]|nr:PilC/PilY family type IV pilus protein [Desulfobacterales bacterium]